MLNLYGYRYGNFVIFGCTKMIKKLYYYQQKKYITNIKSTVHEE